MKHVVHYSGLIFLMLLGVGVSIITFYNRQLQMIAVLCTVVLYVLWGILHHHLHHDLSSKIVVEYVLIGALGMVVVFFFLRGGIL